MDFGKDTHAPPSHPRIIRVKRSAVEADMPIPPILCNMEDDSPVFYMLADDDIQMTVSNKRNKFNKDEIDNTIANLLNYLQSDTVKRLRVEGIPHGKSLESLSLNDEDSNSKDDFFIYIQQDANKIDTEILEDPTAVGLVFFNDILVNEPSDSDSDYFGDEGEDSNAENYYANDYPEEEDEDHDELSENFEGSDYYRETSHWSSGDEVFEQYYDRASDED